MSRSNREQHELRDVRVVTQRQISTKSHISSMPVEELAKIWRPIFNQLDHKRKGYIKIEELAHLINGTDMERNLPREVVAEVVERADIDRDGKIDFNEFLDMIRDWELGDQRPVFRKMIHYAAMVAIPRTGRKKRERQYINEYKCCPPPLFMILITLVEVGIFIYYTYMGGESWLDVVGPVPDKSVLIYNPYKRHEVWRFLTYMLLHAGFMHIFFNILVQLALGIPLEMVHRWWRVLLVYFIGVIAGSLGTSISDPHVYLLGASGGVYALLCAHFASIIINWREMEYAWFRLLLFTLLVGSDVGVAIYYRYVGEETKTGYAAHFAGGLAGLLIGIGVLRNLYIRQWERVVWWISFALFSVLIVTAIVWNIAYPSYFLPLVYD